MTYFLDTCICIHALKQPRSRISARIRRTGPMSIKMPAIVVAELLLGALKSRNPAQNATVVERFLHPFEIIPFCAHSAARYATIRAELERQGQIIGPNDLIIAATVAANDGILVTHNTREFQRIKQLKLRDWTT